MKTIQLTMGILAHVDAGKTTLSESILYETGKIEKIGRVDHQDAYLDTYELEKDRGITIFSKQAVFALGDFEMTLLDTPGHVDFSAEMERVLRVLDYAVLVISGSDGVQGHTRTVWKLLRQYHLPTFIFVNKMDLPGADQSLLLEELQERLDENCLAFNAKESVLWDQLALCDERLMEAYLEGGRLDRGLIQEAVLRRHVFPVYFGSALKSEGVTTFLEGFGHYIQKKSYPSIFGARVFKVVRDDHGDRLTYLKITGGSLKVKALLTNRYQRNVELSEDARDQVWQEKVDQIRVYSGSAYERVKEISAGGVCAVTGLTKTKPGDGLGFEQQGDGPELVPVLSYKVNFPEGTNVFGMLKKLRLLEEEEPHLNVIWNEHLSEVHLQVMGEIQLEILTATIMERYGVAVTFDRGSLVYRETIAKPVIGKGHFEPLKHYAEVHLLMEPLPRGSGMVYTSDCSEDVLDRNWQRLVVSHLKERSHPGVLTGSDLTDMKVSLLTGRGHNKHTEGGDFREATFRALRQGLMKGESILLEPIYTYRLELPKELLGRAMSDIERMSGSFEDPLIAGDLVVIKGTAPVAEMMHYNAEVVTYSRGQGRLELSLKGYEACHQPETVIKVIGYDPQRDLSNPVGSVFCSKGVGYGVPWDEADSHMHMDSGLKLTGSKVAESRGQRTPRQSSGSITDKELEAIFVKTYGEQKDGLQRSGRIFDGRRSTSASGRGEGVKAKEPKEKFLLVDGYNILFSWEELSGMAEENIDGARHRLMDLLSNYQGQTEETVILVFDAYRVAGRQSEMSKYHNIHVVFTKEAETADQYIERLVHKIRPAHEVTVATSDVVEQIIILGKGARRLSADGLKLEMDAVIRDYQQHMRPEKGGTKYRPFEAELKDLSD